MASSGGLNVIALVSGGKDSFFSALHCLENGHRLIALANLHPPPPPPPSPSLPLSAGSRPGGPEVASVGIASGEQATLSARVATLHLDRHAAAAAAAPQAPALASDRPPADDDKEEEVDLNSFMYQTVGHQVIPLYTEATGLPLYRRPIVGGAVHSGRDYAADSDSDETESMVPLLKAVLAAHPEANALSAGAILSTYQRTRVESVALRLGLTPLAYLWKYPVLPSPAQHDEAQLLMDMAGAGLEARIIKVASGGLDESFLWENVAGSKGIARLKRAMARFGSETGGVLGEGGEFETLVVDGPNRLFSKRVVVKEEDRVVVKEGGGTAWVKVTKAVVEDKPPSEEGALAVRRPELWDERFTAVVEGMGSVDEDDGDVNTIISINNLSPYASFEPNLDIATWTFTNPNPSKTLTIQEETTHLINTIRTRLAENNLPPAVIQSTLILLRNMADFPTINPIYATLFPFPNPPSRVTISCGNLIPSQAGNIAISLTLSLTPTTREGLHVQSRSYWAPANIGPYSQAISVNQVVHIAGQIPLVPASMDFLPATPFNPHVALSLQHLWRIGTEVGVQWWTSAAVYFPRATNTTPTSTKARLAARAWEAAHLWAAQEDEDESGPDLWDRKFNPLYMSYEAGSASKRPALPDYSLFDLDDDDEDDEGKGQAQKKKPVPFFFAVEVEELPRGAEAEWHAHAGLAKLGDASVRQYRDTKRVGVETAHCVLATEDGGGCVHSVVAVAASAAESRPLEEEISETDNLLSGTTVTPYLLYVDTGAWSADEVGSLMSSGMAVVPCASIWGASGERLKLVALYRTQLSKSA